MSIATAIAHPNIALCKYWGKRDRPLNLPATPSLSLTLAPFSTRTTVNWGAEADEAWLNGKLLEGREARRIFMCLDLLDPWRPRCVVTSENNFPTAAGLASSSSGFAALVVAADAASGRRRSIEDLAVFARRGSGSATRSLFGGWVEWPMGTRADGADSHGIPIAPEDHWDVRMLVAVLAPGPKETSSTEGMLHTQQTSPYFPVWTECAPRDVAEAKIAVKARDLEALGRIVERSAMRMHASMLAADPPLCYWRAGTLAAVDAVRRLRAAGTGAWYTMDAGPNVKVLCEAADAEKVRAALAAVAERVEVLSPGGPARVE
ncbi:MAG: diphosphomevalonate decarboxylase [Myxococcota bacterium]